MSLAPGTRIGVYQIAAQIGVGGMGEVYQATDTNLKRQVAIKVLPASVAGDADRLARFQREAEVLAALNHPNIASIFGLEKAPDFTALVMELVEGEDLSQRIAPGAIPLDDALPIAKQIAEALEAAHEQGIVHRDLKPANIKVRADGTVKVLDFGLAKALDAPAKAGAHNLTQSPTITSPAMTQAGMILGTAAYMSPEQARGKTVDKRADIWAFGVVLFEMLAGRRPFDGEDIADVLGAVVRLEPPWEALPSDVPPLVRTLLQGCLVKDPRRRVADISTALFVLDKAAALASVPAEIAKSEGPDVGWRQMLPWAVTAAALAAAVALWAPWRAETPVDRPLVRLDVDLGADVSFLSANAPGSSLAISPDGTRLVYLAFGSGASSRLFTRRLDQSNATELPGTQNAARPFFSPDGQWVGFAVGVKVNKVSVEGGAVVPLAEVANFGGASWAEDGSIIVSDGAGGKGLLQLPAAGGAPSIVAARGPDEIALTVPQLLPGGKAILFIAAAGGTGGADAANIEVLTLADGRRKTLLQGGHSPHYLSSNGAGHMLYVNKATLFAIPFDLETLETRGTAVPVLDDVAYAVFGNGHFAVSRTGTLIYRKSRGDAAAMATVQWVTPVDGSTSKQAPLRATPDAYGHPRLSPDGRRIALVVSEGSQSDVWVYDPQRDALTRLTFGGANRAPTWSPDGQYVVFYKPGQGIFQTRTDGASQPQALTGSKTTQLPWSFTPDGKRLAYYENSQLWTVPLDEQGGQLKAGTPEPFLKSTFSDLQPSFSPDGRWLAYHSDESGRREVYVRAFPPPSASSSGAAGQGGKWQVSNNGGEGPRWSRTGHELVYRAGDQLMTVSYAVNGSTFVADKPRVWIAALRFGGMDGDSWDLAPDGKRVAVVILEGSAQASQQEHVIVMLQNFADELRRRVPLGK